MKGETSLYQIRYTTRVYHTLNLPDGKAGENTNFVCSLVIEKPEKTIPPYKFSPPLPPIIFEESNLNMGK